MANLLYRIGLALALCVAAGQASAQDAAPSSANGSDSAAAGRGDRADCREPVMARQARHYSNYRDRYLADEARWRYCTGQLDSLPAWARSRYD